MCVRIFPPYSCTLYTYGGGIIPFTTESLTIPTPGAYYIDFQYSKTFQTSPAGANAVWIDNVRFQEPSSSVSSNITFNTGGAPTLTVASSGNVGIGVTIDGFT